MQRSKLVHIGVSIDVMHREALTEADRIEQFIADHCRSDEEVQTYRQKRRRILRFAAALKPAGRQQALAL